MTVPSLNLPYAKTAIAICGGLMTLACVLWNLDVPTRLGLAILTEQYLALQLAFSIFIVFLSSSFRLRETDAPRVFGWVIAVIGIITLIYTAIHYVGLLEQEPFRPPALTWIGAVVVFCVMEGVRRRAGLALFLIVAVFMPAASLITMDANPNIPGLHERSTIIKIPWVMITYADESEDLVYRMTKVIAENYDKLGQSFGAFKRGASKQMAPAIDVPYHLGALKYYKEAGIPMGK